MNQLFKGRMTADIDGDFVVLLIGMRFNKPWKIHKWAWMTYLHFKMTHDLKKDPESGFLHQEMAFGRTVIMVQYWRSIEALHKFANDQQQDHSPNAGKFSTSMKQGKADVGLWHELYHVTPGHYEAVYLDMPAFGLAHVGEHLPISKATNTSQARIEKPLLQTGCPIKH